MRAKQKQFPRPSIPRSILPAITESKEEEEITIATPLSPAKQAPSDEDRLEIRKKLRERLQLHREMLLLKRHAVPLPPNQDGTPLTSKTLPESLSETQREAIRARMRQTLRLRMIKKGQIPSGQRDELSNGKPTVSHETSHSAFGASHIDDCRLQYEQLLFEQNLLSPTFFDTPPLLFYYDDMEGSSSPSITPDPYLENKAFKDLFGAEDYLFSGYNHAWNDMSSLLFKSPSIRL